MCTPHSSLHTLHSTLYTPHSTLYTLHFTLHTPHPTLHTLHSTLHTLHSTLRTLHSTLLTLHSALHTPNSTLSTSHSTLYTLHSTLQTGNRGNMYKTVPINYCRKVFCVTAYPGFWTSVPLTYVRASFLLEFPRFWPFTIPRWFANNKPGWCLQKSALRHVINQ